jgi:NAD(P)-dependent dehydrogenase (short-subunit alcohol dehydrogenase family)
MFTNREFDGLTALVTGASNGIGAEAAVKFAERGARVLIHYNTAKDQAERVLERVRQAGSDGAIAQADLSNPEGIATFIGWLQDRPVDILVNNAGSLIQRTRFLDFTEELWDKVFRLNLHSAMRIIQAVLPHMIEQKRGYVVNISSVAARNGGGLGAIAYSSSKGALSVMTKGLAKEFAPMGIRVNGVSPGTVDTNYHRTFSTEAMLNAVRAATPMARLGTPEEVADVIVFLCSEGARFVCGQMIEVNGGFLLV